MSEETSCPGLGCLPKISDTWRNVSGAFTSTNRVYPSDPVPPKDSEFISVDSKINIRVIHFMPDKARDLFVISPEPSSKRMSISEEYWFTKNKPLRNTSCNCSFRNSFRKSLRNSTKTLTVDVQLNECLEKPSSSISQQKQETLEQFAQGFVEQTLSNALDECTKKTILNNTEGIENPSYEISEVDSAVRLRNQKMNKDSHKVPPDSSLPSLKNCIHKNIKPLIMLLHGLGSTAEVWNTLMHNLALRGFEVIAPDMLGHGFSSAPNKASCYQFKNLVNQFSTVFDYYMKKENQRKCVLIGHSYGCSIITALYPTRATKIAQLILISGGGPTPLAPPADMNEISRYGWAHHLCHPFMYCGLKRSFFYSSRGKNFKFCEDESSVPPHFKDFLIHGQQWLEGDASFHRRILVPTLLVHGLLDKNVTLVQECEMERTIPRSFLELIPDAGHMAMLESSEHLTHMICCFLEMWI